MLQSSMPSSGSPKMAQKTSPSPSRPTTGSTTSPGAADPNHPEPLGHEPSSKADPSPERRDEMDPEAQQQQQGRVQEELKMAGAENPRVPVELAKMKSPLANGREESDGPGRIQMLRRETEKAKESERKMLESLVFQTKQLEQTKTELEEARLEIRYLRESIRGLERFDSVSSGNLDRFPGKPLASDSTHSQQEVARLTNELKSAIEAEERNRKAMDSLALALREVMTERNQVTGKLSTTRSELERVRAEADCSKSMLKTTEDKFRMVLLEVGRLRVEADESAAAWSTKENGFISCMKASEEELTKVMQENSRLSEAQQVAREENSKLRDIMKQALNEANAVKGALEIASRENSQLKDLLSEKEHSLEAIKQELECLKVSEAAALNRIKGSKALLAASSTTVEKSTSARSVALGSLTSATAMQKPGTTREVAAKFPSDRWTNDGPRTQDGLKLRGASSSSLVGSMSERAVSSGKHWMYKSLRCVSDTTVPSLRRLGDDQPLIQSKPKTKPILQKFGQLSERVISSGKKDCILGCVSDISLRKSGNGEAQESDDFEHTDMAHLGGINSRGRPQTRPKKKLQPTLGKFGEKQRPS